MSVINHDVLSDYRTPFFLILIPLIILYLAGRRKFSPRPGEAPYTSYLIPWVGNIIAGSWNYEGYMAEQAKIHHNRPFTFHILGMPMTCFSSSHISSAYYRNLDLSFEAMILPLIRRAFQLPENGLQYMKQSFMDPLYTRYLTSTKGAGEWVERYAGSLGGLLQVEITGWNRAVGGKLEVGGWREVELVAWSKSLVYKAACAALFGPSFPAAESEKVFWMVDENIFELFKGLPGFMIPGVKPARKKVHAMIQQFILEGRKEEWSEFLRAREGIHEQRGVAIETRAILSFISLWGLQSNTPQAAIWTLLHTITNPQLLSSIRSEIKTVLLPTATLHPDPLASFDLPALVELPHLNALMTEVLRYYLTSGSIRMATRDTSITDPTTGETYRIRKDALVQLVLQHVNFDSSVHASPEVFDPYRYFDKEKGKLDVGSKAYRIGHRPFGGGSAFCPGRVFAVKEIAAFVATMVWWFDIEPLETRRGVPPPAGVTKQGIQPVKGKFKVRMRVRKLD